MARRAWYIPNAPAIRTYPKGKSNRSPNGKKLPLSPKLRGIESCVYGLYLVYENRLG